MTLFSVQLLSLHYFFLVKGQYTHMRVKEREKAPSPHWDLAMLQAFTSISPSHRDPVLTRIYTWHVAIRAGMQAVIGRRIYLPLHSA